LQVGPERRNKYEGWGIGHKRTSLLSLDGKGPFGCLLSELDAILNPIVFFLLGVYK
jgi:hypothetical protein